MLMLPPRAQRSVEQQRTYSTAMSTISRLKKANLEVLLTSAELYEVLINKNDDELIKLDKSKGVITMDSFKKVKKIAKQEKNRIAKEAILKRFIDSHPDHAGLTIELLYAKLQSSGVRITRPLIIDDSAPVTIDNVMFKSLKTEPETKQYYAIARVMREKMRLLHDKVTVSQTQLTLKLIKDGYQIKRADRHKRWSVIDDTKPVTLENLRIDYGCTR